ncbi:MAG: tetratricopeptide repeat protein [Planctomycetota bacterium]|jgi:tetratricopeptide (TPR) repeat protein
MERERRPLRRGGWIVWLAAAILAPPAAAEENALRTWVQGVYQEFYSGDLKAAVDTYQKFQSHFTTHRRAPDARLRTALCWEKRGDLEKALQLARKVKSEYPRAAAACSRAEEVIKRLEGQAAQKREFENLFQENEALRERIALLSSDLTRATESLQRGAQDEAERLREIETLKARIEALLKEKSRLQQKLEARRAAEEENLTPEEILSQLEREHKAREEKKRIAAEHLFRTGLRLQGEEKLEEARENFRKCLELWDGHPKAKEHLMQVGALLGDPKSIQKEMLRQLEIQKELRVQEKKQELAVTLRNAFDLYRAKSFEEAARIFRKALDILVQFLPEGEEFDRQKDLAARYIRLCQKASASRDAKPPTGYALETRLQAVLLPRPAFQAFLNTHALHFAKRKGALSAAHAILTSEQKNALLSLIREKGTVVLNEKCLLVTQSDRTLRKFLLREDGKPGPGFSLKLTPRITDGKLRLTLAANILLAPTKTLRFPGKKSPVEIDEVLSQHVSSELEIPARGTGLVAGLRNPFPPETGEEEKKTENPKDLLFIVEVLG